MRDQIEVLIKKSGNKYEVHILPSQISNRVGEPVVFAIRVSAEKTIEDIFNSLSIWMDEYEDRKKNRTLPSDKKPTG